MTGGAIRAAGGREAEARARPRSSSGGQSAPRRAPRYVSARDLSSVMSRWSQIEDHPRSVRGSAADFELGSVNAGVGRRGRWYLRRRRRDCRAVSRGRRRCDGSPRRDRHRSWSSEGGGSALERTRQGFLSVSTGLGAPGGGESLPTARPKPAALRARAWPRMPRIWRVHQVRVVGSPAYQCPAVCVCRRAVRGDGNTVLAAPIGARGRRPPLSHRRSPGGNG